MRGWSLAAAAPTQGVPLRIPGATVRYRTPSVCFPFSQPPRFPAIWLAEHLPKEAPRG
jgi:hypothetical protein